MAVSNWDKKYIKNVKYDDVSGWDKSVFKKPSLPLFKGENIDKFFTSVGYTHHGKTPFAKIVGSQSRYWKDWWYKTKSGARKHPHKSLFSRVLGAVSPPNQINPATGKRAYTLKFAYGGRAWRKLFTSPPGTKPQKIKHFPAQRIKTKDPVNPNQPTKQRLHTDSDIDTYYGPGSVDREMKRLFRKRK